MSEMDVTWPLIQCHSALRIPEILHAILAFLASDYPDPITWDLRGNMGTLAAAAVTCRDWSDPALEVLWRQVEDTYLFRLLGPLDEYYNGTLGITRPPRPADLSRFLLAASRIKTLVSNVTIHDSLQAYLEEAISASSRPALQAVTRIQSFGWHLYEPQGLFFGPNLRYLHLGGPFPSSRHESDCLPYTLTEVSSTAGRLETLILHLDDFPSPSIGDRLSQIVSLKRFELLYNETDGTVVYDIVEGAGRLPFLEKLSVGYEGVDDEGTISWGDFPKSSFPSLSHLTIRTLEDATMSTFVQNLAGHAKLRQLNYYDYDEPRTSTNLRDVILAAGQHENLEKLDLQEDWLGNIHIDLLRPLVQCHGLQELFVTTCGSSELTDRQIEEFTSGLPLLRVLRFHCSGWIDSPPATTLRALDIITTNCPLMETVSLDVDASKLPEHLPLHPAEHFCLLELGQHHIQNRKPLTVALYLSYLSSTPGRFEVTNSDWGTRFVESRRVWKAVRDLVPKLQKALPVDRERLAEEYIPGAFVGVGSIGYLTSDDMEIGE